MSPLQVAKSSGELAFVPCIPMLRDCPLCLLSNSQAAPSYRQSFRQAVGDLPFVPCVPMLRDCPSAYSATHRPCRLIGGQSGGQLETCPRAAEVREGREVTVSTT